ncbi:MAG: GTPase Era [Pseudomonadota bacterium]
MSVTEEKDFRCGFVAIVGRPNVGKSTLLNQVLGQKISITARKPQTTRHSIRGIKTTEDAQIIYVDTPGIHLHGKRAMNRYLNRTASGSIEDVDAVVFVVEGAKWTEEDQAVFERVTQSGHPIVLAINKIDQIKDKTQILPLIEKFQKMHGFAAIVPISARTGKSVENLEQEIKKLLPLSHPFYPEEQITDRSERFLAAEIIREKLFRNLGDEIPYALTVEIEKFAEEDGMLHICGLIWVERPGQKVIVIGKDGEKLKLVGQEARKDMNRLFDRKVYLQLWVKVKEGWSDDERALRSLGYSDEL